LRTSKTNFEEVFRLRRPQELSTVEFIKFHEALSLIQKHIGEFRELGYDGPDLDSYNAQVGAILDLEKGWRCIFSFPKLIPGGVAGSAQLFGSSVYLATLAWEWRSVKAIACIVAHEILHLSIGMFHDRSEVGNPTNPIDEELARIFDVSAKDFTRGVTGDPQLPN